MKTKTLFIFLAIFTIIWGGLGYWASQIKVVSVSAADWKTYTNPTAGLSFEYPSSWKFQDPKGNEDPITHGDIMKDGKIYTSFTSGLFPPDWGQTSPTYLSIEHSPLASATGKSYDNLSIQDQLKEASCGSSTDSKCPQYTNKNGVQYVKYAGCNSVRGECYISVSVPTGKYVMHFSISAGDLGQVPGKVAVFNKIIDSVQLR